MRGVSLKKSATMLALLMLQLLVIRTLILSAQPGSNLHGSISGLSLLAIQNNEDSGGVEIIIISNNTRNLSEQQQSQIHIPGHSLSSGCGDHYFRCQGDNLLVRTLFLEDGRKFEVIFIPLDDDLLLLSHWCDSTSQRVANNCSWNTTLSNSLSTCRPTVVYNINSKFYTVCTSSINQYFSVYEVRLYLSGTAIENATLLGPLTEIRIFNSLSTSNVSNFIIVDQRIYFAIGSTIVVLDILDSTQTRQYPELPQCPQVYKLVESVGAGNQKVLIAYCTDRYILYDPVYGDWSSRFLFSSSGVPYLCPNNNYRATFFIESGILQFLVQGILSDTINNANVSSGICFESQNTTYFAYSDQQHENVYVYNFIRQIDYPVSPYFCLQTHQECPQLFTLLDNQYLVIRDSNCDRILDTKTDFSLIFNTSSGIADILAVLHIISNTGAITPSPPSTTTESAPSSRADEVLTSDSIVVSTADIQTDIPEDNVPSTGLPNEVTTNAAPITTTNLTSPITEQSKSTDLQLPLIIVGSIAALVIIINIIAITVYFFKRYRKHHR